MDLAALDLQFRTDGADKALADVNRLTAAAAKAERAAGGMGAGVEQAARKAVAANDNLARSASKVTSAYDRMVVAARKVITVIGALGGLLVGAALVRYADVWTDITSRVNIAAGSIENGQAVMQRLDAMARRTYSSMNQTADSYLLNATAMRELGYSTNETLDFVEAINNALVVSGAKGDRAASVMNALSKAMAMGKLSGDELNTVISVGGRVAEALAAGMGVTTNQLRSLGQQGKITGDVLAKALIGQLETLREEADGMAATIGDGMLLIGNAILSVVGRFDQATGASAALAGVLVSVADGIKAFGEHAVRAAQIAGAVLGPVIEMIAEYGEALAVGFKIAGAALIGWLGPVAVGAVLSLAAAIGTTLVGAVKALTIAMMANPIGLFVGAIAAAVTAVYLFRDEIKEAIGVDVVKIAKDAANLFVGAWVGTFEAIRIVWSDLPGVMGDLAVQAGNLLIAGIEGAINILIPKIRQLYRILNPIAGLADLVGGGTGDVFGTGLLDNFKADFGRFDNQFAGRASGAAASVSDAFTGALFTDYIGALQEVIAGTRSAADATADLDAKVKAAGSSMDDKASKAAQKLAKAYQDIVDRAYDFIRAQELEARLVGMTDQAANALRYDMDAFAEARREGICLSVEQKNAVHELAAAFEQEIDQ
jgi:tape measure domain-containing protein